MFADMGALAPDQVEQLVAATIVYLAHALPAGEYVGWLAAVAGRPAEVVAGAGVLRRRVPPHPLDGGAVAEGRQGLVLNVYTEPAWRRRGLAARLMAEVLAWAQDAGLESLVLHASAAGRSLYERLGFAASNELRYPARLLLPPGRGAGRPGPAERT
jgi:GNAT superfamily N-acetyltransferase